MNKLIPALAVIAAASPVSSHAQGRHAVSIIPAPYACVQLNVPPGYLADHPTVTIPLYAAPSASAKVVGQAGDTMVAKWPQAPHDGFYQVALTLDVTAWIEARYLRPWANPYAPSARCSPAVMSDGTIGIR